MSFRRVLVANRGEIACRVLRTLRAMGIPTATVCSEADLGAPHVGLADRVRVLGPAPAAQSYLDIGRVVAAGEDLGCDAVHPGYGFLSENPAFARACSEAGLTFIGPPPEAIRVMGDKAEARRLAREAGVAPVPGYEGADDEDALAREAERIGFPLLVKAAAGGGGKGMRRVGAPAALPDAVAGARREARAAFGESRLLLERLVHPARHVEVQVMADAHGHVAAVLERECSLQRRHQKVIEECPSPAVGPDLRRELSEAACRLAGRVGYTGAGTVEFLLEEDGRFWFLEMNTRLQVEHGVTELVCGLDLVAWQVRIAAGEPFPWSIGDFTPRGHAIEARVYAEDPAAGFLPQSGRIEGLLLPQGPGVRVDSGVQAGQEVTPHYDPLLLKLLGWGGNREDARGQLLRGLRETAIAGLVSNLSWLIDLVGWEAFREGRTYTHSLEAEGPDPRPQRAPPEEAWWMALAALELRRDPAAAPAGGPGEEGDRWSPFGLEGPFRLVPRGGAP